MSVPKKRAKESIVIYSVHTTLSSREKRFFKG